MDGKYFETSSSLDVEQVKDGNKIFAASDLTRFVRLILCAKRETHKERLEASQR